MQTLPEGATNIGLALSYYAHGGGLLADVLLVDASGSGVFQVTPKGYAMDQHAAHSFPFRIDGNLETVVTVANPSGDKDIAFSLFVLYDGESYTYTGGNLLKPGEVRYVNIKTLRDRQTAGLFGKTIPRSVSTGQVKVMFHVKRSGAQDDGGHAGHGGHGYGQAVGTSSVVVYDTVEKISFTSCAPPPPPQYPDCVLVDVFDDDDGFDCEYPPDSSRIDIPLDEPTDFAIYVAWTGYGVEALTEAILNAYEAGIDFDYNDNYFEVDPEAPISEVTAIGLGEHELTVSLETSEGEIGTQVQVRVLACNLSINTDSLSPSNGTLPQRNPAKIINTNNFDSEFIVSRSEAVCSIQWSIDSGGSSYAHIVSTSDTIVTVNGDSVGDFNLRATTFFGKTVYVSVPVVNVQTVDVKVWITKDDNGNNPVTDQTRVNNDIADANLIWAQCGIQFNLVSTGAIHSTAVIIANATERDLLRSWNANHVNTGAIEVVYVDAFASPDQNLTGEATGDGIVINASGNTRTAAHELGHAMGLSNGGEQNVQLMHGNFSTTKADITKIECNSLTKFTSD
jgi:hypothetical protein